MRQRARKLVLAVSTIGAGAAILLGTGGTALAVDDGPAGATPAVEQARTTASPGELDRLTAELNALQGRRASLDAIRQSFQADVEGVADGGASPVFRNNPAHLDNWQSMTRQLDQLIAKLDAQVAEFENRIEGLRS
jgi:hypothetical protein